MKVEHVPGISFPPGGAPQDEGNLAVGHRLLGEVIVNDEDILPLVHEILGHGATGIRRDVLERGRIRGAGNDQPLVLGSKEFIPGFEDQMIGAASGDKRTVEVSFPEDYGSEDLQGRPAVFEVSVDGHFVEELPELNDDFAQDIGHESMDQLRTSLAERFQNDLDQERNRRIDDSLVGVLLERSPVTAPPSMVRGQLEHQAQRLTQMLLMQGVPYEQAISMALTTPQSVGSGRSA